MSGGDDLESDDEYLDQNWGKDEAVAVALDESIRQQEKREESKKRDISEIQSNDEAEVVSKKKKPASSKRLLLEAGRGIADESTSVQAQFLWTCFTNSLRLKGEEIPDQKIEASDFKKSSKNKDSNTKYDPSMSKFLKSGVLKSAKKLKKWKHNKCPMVLIICASARRAVAILKEISSLNVRAAKLFAKHMSIADQKAMLENNKYSIAVGTPNRLLKLVQANGSDDDDDESEDGDGEAALSLDETELVIIDCHEDKKCYTVCTMNDTAPDLMMFIKDAVLPQLESKNLKLAFF